MGVTPATPGRLAILPTCDRGMVPWRLMRFETRRRVVSLSRSVMEFMPMLIPCSMPNKKNAVTIENTVKIVRTFFRHRPAHTNVKYFIAFVCGSIGRHCSEDYRRPQGTSAGVLAPAADADN